MLTIKTTGVEDFVDGSANIKALIIGGPGAGKTRMSSYWPKPLYLDAENGRGSLADRNMPYVEIKTSRDMLDALEYLKAQERAPKAERQFQTVVVDTVDSFQRLVKDEWVQQTKAGSFTGYDAWGYLDTKMQLLFTRLLNLDYNVIVLVHYTSKEHKDGDNTVREFALQLQGAVKDQVFNDFGLVGWLGTFWAAGEEGRVQKRGLTFQPTPDKPFLKDRYNVTPKWMEINFEDNDYRQLFEAFFNRPEFEGMPESAVVGEIPDADTLARVAPPGVTRPAEGGPLPERAPAAPAAVSLDKMLKGELEDVARGLGIAVRGNMLKGEIVEAIKAKRAEPGPAPQPPAEAITKGTDVAEQRPDPTSPPSSNASAPAADAAAASSEDSGSTATSSGPDASQAQPMSVEATAAALGAEVISHETTDAASAPQPATPSTTATKPAGPSACADCGGDLTNELTDPTKRDYLRLSKAKHKRYLCATCHDKASGK